MNDMGSPYPEIGGEIIFKWIGFIVNQQGKNDEKSINMIVMKYTMHS